jgi:hypothetical protein
MKQKPANTAAAVLANDRSSRLQQGSHLLGSFCEPGVRDLKHKDLKSSQGHGLDDTNDDSDEDDGGVMSRSDPWFTDELCPAVVACCPGIDVNQLSAGVSSSHRTRYATT